MDYIYIGKIIGTHGIKGEVKVKSDSDFKTERFKKNNILYVKRGEEMVKITINSHRVHNKFDLITFNDLTNINDVLDYISRDIYIHKDQLPELAEDEYYYHQLIGLKVCDDNEKTVGEITDVREYPQGAMLILKKSEGGEAMVPFVEVFVKKVDLEKRQVIITPIEGLL